MARDDLVQFSLIHVEILMFSQEILINQVSRETRVAFVSTGVLTELHIEKRQQQSLVGNIYYGRVSRVVSSIQAAFIDIGLNRAGFLHFKDFLSNSNQSKNIQDLLQVGQKILVQVTKDTFGVKGVRLTMLLNIPGRFLVLTPNVLQLSVSQKINNLLEAQRLKNLLQPSEFGGYIFRTAAENISAELLLAEKKYLDNLWQNILSKLKKSESQRLIYTEMPLEIRILRDSLNENFSRILVDDADAFMRIKQFIFTYFPKFSERVFFHDELNPIFDLYGIEQEIQKSLQRTVYLKSGGYLVFDQSEAMTTIDVNSGSAINHKTQPETAMQVNLAAVPVIARQVCLRNLGGIIIIDFIDLAELSQQEILLNELKKAFAEDFSRTEISEITSLGLVQMTRKRGRNSLLNILCDPCPTCRCRGSVKSIETIACDMLRSAQRTIVQRCWSGLRIQASPDLIDFINTQAPDLLAELVARVGCQVELIGDSRYLPEHYDILPMLKEN